MINSKINGGTSDTGYWCSGVSQPKPKRSILLAFAAVLIAAIPPSLTAQMVASPQSLTSIRNATHKFLKLEMSKRKILGKIVIGRLNQDLHLAQCSKELEVSFPRKRKMIGNLSIGVSCRGINTWTFYVPVRIGVISKVLVASHALAQGHKISIEDVQMVSMDLANLSDGYLLTQRAVIGKSLRQALTIGAVITPASIRSVTGVHRGEKVTILAHRKGVEVRMQGIALADGSPGDRIKVRNSINKEINEGIITKHGEVRVDI